MEIQGTGETAPFSRQELSRLLDLAEKGVFELIDLQKSLFMQDLTKGGSEENRCERGAWL